MASEQDIIHINSVRLAHPLVEQRISEYAKVNPNTRIVIADIGADLGNIGFASQNETDLEVKKNLQ
ncbi:hypothetical protein EZS27_009204 [termite gut metagenome]|uniref:Uncharacterized protein n=1 Tax=termite gut metagenome TaxID=433724 RepID=A0A5J4SA81_9ZZZZ